ncbi:hypothetical protein [Clostridium botulinum]|uniref:hypothetical protein n=1 Tax=Clostridium botulinum TaxID=1491 RepID=UPI003DA4A32F
MIYLNNRCKMYLPHCGRCTCPRGVAGSKGITVPRGATGPEELGTIYVYRNLTDELVVATNEAISYDKVGPMSSASLYSSTSPSTNITINETGLYRIYHTALTTSSNEITEVFINNVPVPASVAILKIM